MKAGAASSAPTRGKGKGSGKSDGNGNGNGNGLTPVRRGELHKGEQQIV